MTTTEHLCRKLLPMGARPEVNGPSARKICVHADPRKRDSSLRQESSQVRVIASTKNWIEGAAVQQLEKTAALPGMRVALEFLHFFKRRQR